MANKISFTIMMKKIAKFVGITYIIENLRTELASSTKLIFWVNGQHPKNKTSSNAQAF